MTRLEEIRRRAAIRRAREAQGITASFTIKEIIFLVVVIVVVGFIFK